MVVEFNLQELRYQRISREISQQEMADALDIKRTAYFKREKGLVKLGVDEFAKVLEVMHIPPEQAGIFFKVKVPKREFNTL